MTETTGRRTTARRPLDLLLLTLRLDAAVTGANGAGYLLLAGPLADLLGVPAGTLRLLGGFLLAYAAAVALVAARRPISGGAVEAVIGANTLWVVGSVAAVVLGWFDLTAVGTAWVLLQAAVVTGFAAAQLIGLRRR
jgi:hypothetical protein